MTQNHGSRSIIARDITLFKPVIEWPEDAAVTGPIRSATTRHTVTTFEHPFDNSQYRLRAGARTTTNTIDRTSKTPPSSLHPT